MKEIGEKKPVVLFDGVCNLCNSSVNFIVRNDPKASFLFASLQSEFGQKFLDSHGLDKQNFRTLYLVKPEGSYLSKSNAALWICGRLSLPWSLLSVFSILPRFFRDWLYDMISKYRYGIFGRKNECQLPTPALRSRFLD